MQAGGGSGRAVEPGDSPCLDGDFVPQHKGGAFCSLEGVHCGVFVVGCTSLCVCGCIVQEEDDEQEGESRGFF